MKRNLFFQFLNVIVFCSLCLYSHNSCCQTTIHENTYNTTEFSIIKNFKTDIDIKYDVWPTRRFEYIDRGTNMIYTVTVSNLYVMDFEIYEGYVYFCGNGEFNSKVDNFGAAFGYFNIDSVFSTMGLFTTTFLMVCIHLRLPIHYGNLIS